jgi:DNA polymerase (family 10)
LRVVAQQKKLSLSEHGFVDQRTKKVIVCGEENDVYERLNMKFIEPELREDRGEIEAAISGQLPNLIKLDDIGGDLHIHSKFSDGTSSLEDIVKKAKELGFSYLGIADHVAGMRNSVSFPKNLDLRAAELKKISERLDIPIINAAEVDIKKNGELELGDQYLKKFELIIASIHTNFDLSKEENTRRLIKAIENPYVKVIGHPTTRKINLRPPIEFDWPEIFEACLKNKVALEISAQPIRMDLTDNLVFEAREKRIKFLVNTDAHNSENLDFIKYGISVARRGWCEKEDVLNTLSYKDLQKWLVS